MGKMKENWLKVRIWKVDKRTGKNNNPKISTTTMAAIGTMRAIGTMGAIGTIGTVGIMGTMENVTL